MFNVRVITLAVTLAISGAALSAAPIASANGPIAAATATDDHNRGQGQPADDNGTQAEPGDDNSTRAEPGDDKNRNVVASGSSGVIKSKTAVKAKRHAHIRHGSHRVAAR
jgi:hypothetical protein